MKDDVMDDMREAVRERYTRVAVESSSCCGGGQSCSCGSERTSEEFGYVAAELRSLPDGADLTLGCGNPTALAGITAGETVLDLGSGGGIDCFLAARRVGESGRVIGVDMTPEMVARARRSAALGGYTNVEFRLGEIESIPAADASVDLVISNCVINLSPDKPRVFAEVHRILRPGGRLIFSDPALIRDLPASARRNVALFTGCITGAIHVDGLLAIIRQAGFSDVRVESEKPYSSEEQLRPLALEAGVPGTDVAAIAESLVSLTVSARKAGMAPAGDQ